MKQEINKNNIEFVSVSLNDDKLLHQIEILAKEIWYEHYSPIIGEKQVTYMLDKFQNREAMISQIEDGYMYKAVKNNNVLIGYFSVQPREDSLFLSKAYVQKDNRGKGAFTAMLNRIEEIAKDSQKNLIELTVNRHNSNTISIYKSKGFKVIKEEVFDIGNGYVMDDFVMQKQI